jgi:four helix bundle protein
MSIFVYHKLQVWRMAKDLVLDIYRLTKTFTAEEKFGLISQINRAAISVASNIAEGSGRISRKDQAHFSQLAYGSLMELACQLEISRELGFINEQAWQSVSEKIEAIAVKLSRLRSSQLSTCNSQLSSTGGAQ